MRIQILVDNPKSWFVPYGRELQRKLQGEGHKVGLIHSREEIGPGECLFLLSCGGIVPPEVLKLNKHNIVIHASKLPQGRGFAPLIWQILEGKSEIWLTLFEAVQKVDSGEIYYQESIGFEGHELHDELRGKMAEKTLELALKFVREWPERGRIQEGEASWYPKRGPRDSQVDPRKTLLKLFNQLRCASNTDYPAFFEHEGETFTLTIVKKGFGQGDKKLDLGQTLVGLLEKLLTVSESGGYGIFEHRDHSYALQVRRK